MMSLSAYFHALRSAYQAELDDLATDSDGRNVLQKRLKEKRSQIAFLGQMMEVAPEMVAVAFHGAFEFKSHAAMEQLVKSEPDDLPDWDTLAEAVALTHWAQPLADPLLARPAGQRFLTVAAALEYLQHRHGHEEHTSHDATAPDTQGQHSHGRRAALDDEDDAHMHDLDHEEAGADWLADQGFDRKE